MDGDQSLRLDDVVYITLTASGDSKELIRQEHTITLSLKFASDKYLIFHDAYVKFREGEKYQIAKWKFSPEVTKNITNKSDIPCEVTFIIDEVKKTGADKAMPHIVANVTKVSCLQSG